jgi:3',5'-cyclic AMP phosphodiesterase CpdA
MSLVLQISDTHFGTEQPPVVEALVRLARDHAPSLVVLSGDITQRARRRQFRAARAFVDRLGAPATLAIPGNHDIPLFNLAARLFTPYANHCREFGADLEPEFESEQLFVIALNTTRIYRHKDGEVSAEQIARVAQRLERATPSQLRIVVAHQPVAVTRPQEETNLLHGCEAAVRSWAHAGADLILGGHIHLPYVLAPCTDSSPVCDARSGRFRQARPYHGVCATMLETRSTCFDLLACSGTTDALPSSVGTIPSRRNVFCRPRSPN